MRTQVGYMGIYFLLPPRLLRKQSGPQQRTLISVVVSLVWHTIAPLHQPCTIASLASTWTCNYPVCAPRLHPLQLLLPECICFKLLISDCVCFSGCSPIVPTVSCCSPIASASSCSPRLLSLQHCSLIAPTSANNCFMRYIRQTFLQLFKNSVKQRI